VKRAFRYALCAIIAWSIAAPASAWCRMTTSRRKPTATEPCIYPDLTLDPPEQYLAWLEPCSAMSLSVAAPSEDLTEAEVVQVLDRSIATWEAVECGGVPLGIDIQMMEERSTCIDPLYRDGGANVNTVMFVQDWAEREYEAAAFAVTTVWHRRSTGEILDVDMEINERRGPYGICPDDGCVDDRLVDLENVITHEFGHYLGLAHSQVVEATMYASAEAGETIKRDLHPDDIEGLCTIYPAGMPVGECDYTPRGGLQLDCERGCSVSAVGATRSSLAWLAPLLGLLFVRRRLR
jgi:hypothetical protein